MFSSRTNWHHQTNRLSQLLDERRRTGKPIFDLAVSNPTDAGIEYPSGEILAALAEQQLLHYNPNPLGLLSAREAVTEYYAAKGVNVSPSSVLLTASTSEAYSYLFSLLCNPAENVLVPVPSYPLFEYLAQLSHVRTCHYSLRYDGEWHIDLDSVKRAITPTTKAIVVVSPHNPTGMFLKRGELEGLNEIAIENKLALIVDEVFADYPFADNEARARSTAGNADVLTFTLNGISKSCGLPQLKLGWIVTSGKDLERNEALQRLEIIADTFLSVNTPVQVAFPRLLRIGGEIRGQIRKRLHENHSLLRNVIAGSSPVSLLEVEGGWNAILKIPNTRSEEEWVLRLLDEGGVHVFPGYFFEFVESGYLVLSLLAEPASFEKGITHLRGIVA